MEKKHLQGLFGCIWMHQPMGKIFKYCLKSSKNVNVKINKLELIK